MSKFVEVGLENGYMAKCSATSMVAGGCKFDAYILQDAAKIMEAHLHYAVILPRAVEVVGNRSANDLTVWRTMYPSPVYEYTLADIRAVLAAMQEVDG